MLPLLAAALLAAAPAAKPMNNTHCPVMGDKLGPKSKKVVVRGFEYGICCKGCAPQLEKDFAKYCLPDGTPRNARK